MIYREIPICVPGWKENATLTTYLLDDITHTRATMRRPLVILCPGGGYDWTSSREAEPIAIRFLEMGIHAAVLWYSVKPAVFPAALLQLAASVRYMKAHAEELQLAGN